MSDAFSIIPLTKSSSHFYFSNNKGLPLLSRTESDDPFKFTRPDSPPSIFEMVFEKPNDCSSQEEKLHTYDEEFYFRPYDDETFFGDASLIKPSASQPNIEKDDAMIEEETSECSKNDPTEEMASISTRGSIFAGFTNVDSDSISITCEDTYMTANVSELDAKVEAKAFEMFRNKTRQEKEYIEQALPFLKDSIKKIYSECSCTTVTDNMLEAIINELLESKKALLGAEAQCLKGLIDKDIREIQKYRPGKPIEEEDLTFNRRKTRKVLKGNKNNSSLNHVNENYVSNIFQFAKRNFPEDQELQRLANERNVSALNFRRLMHCRLTDNTLTRRAKTRMVESGKELLNNIEYWMNEGYFDQCTDREKYIAQKQKALMDLALGEKN